MTPVRWMLNMALYTPTAEYLLSQVIIDHPGKLDIDICHKVENIIVRRN